MSKFYTWVILLINQSNEMVKSNFQFLAPEGGGGGGGGANWPLNARSSFWSCIIEVLKLIVKKRRNAWQASHFMAIPHLI